MTTDLVQRHCPTSRVVWLPPSLQHGGAEQVVAAARRPPRGACHQVRDLVNASQFARILKLTKDSRAFPAGKNANVGARHRASLLAFGGGSLDVVDTALIGQARADSHIEPRDNCGHWCLPGVPDVFGGALVQHLCDERLPNPRGCAAL